MGSGRLTVVLLVFWMLVGVVEAQEPKRLDYRFSLLEGPRVAVEFWCDGEDSGETEFGLEKEWGGITNDGAGIKDVEAWEGEGQSCRVGVRGGTEWKVLHSAGAKLRVRYVITPSETMERVQGNDYRTTLNADRFQMIGYLGLMAPKWKDLTAVVGEVTMSGFEKAGWEVVSSMGRGEGPWKLEGRLEDMKQSLWLAGKLSVLERTVKGQKIGIAVAGKGWKFRAEDLANEVERIVKAERDFFEDHSDAWYVVTLTPVPQSNPHSSSLGGTALKNAFALYCTPDFEIGSGTEKGKRALILLAHEYFHNWNGIKIPTAGEDPSTYWFSEGFTDFYARRLLLVSGMIDAATYLQELNLALQKYEGNPAREASNDKIREGFWKTADLRDLPYQRGNLMALMLDEHIRSRTKGAKSLDDFMKELHRRPLETPVTTRVLLDRLRSWVDEDVFEMVRLSVLDGGDIRLPETIERLSLRLGTGPSTEFDLGFDLEATKKSKRVEGVKESSAAYAAGVRTGQELKELSIYSGSDPRVKMGVVVEGKVETLEYVPTGGSKPIRQYLSTVPR